MEKELFKSDTGARNGGDIFTNFIIIMPLALIMVVLKMNVH